MKGTGLAPKRLLKRQKRKRSWPMSILLGLDQFVGTIIGPVLFYEVHNEDETISSRLGKLKVAHHGRIPWTYPLAKVIDHGLELIDPGHSIDAIEEDEH